MRDVADRIVDLAFVQGAPRPVGKARALVDLDAEPAVDQVGIPDLLALAERFDRGSEGTVLDWEYLLVTATRS